MANILSMVKLKNKTSRNSFDLSRKNAFTAKVGELLPCACIECLPGDSYSLEVQHFTRTRPVNTAAYTRIREYYDWFFVPTDLLWNKFGSVITQMTDNGQHAQGINANETLSEYMPYTTLGNIGAYLTTAKGKNNMFGYDRSNLSAKLLSYLGYGDLSFYSNDSYTDANKLIVDARVNLFPLLAYQKIYSDWYRNSQWEKAYAPAFNLDYIKGTNDLQIPVTTLDPSDNVMNMFDLRYRNWNKDLFMGVLPSAQYGSAATVFANSGGDSRSFVFDPVVGTSAGQGNNITVGSSKSFASSGAWNSIATTANTALKLGITRADLNTLQTALGTNINILSLRYAEAQQMWAEITQSQQQDYKSQIEAHWNVSLSDAYSDRCHWIDGSVSNLDISEVVNTNITETNEASIAGKGVGVGQSRANFKTDVHGYLICIYSALPLLDYSISGIKRMCTRTQATDFAIPEFDSVGMETLGVEQLINSVFQTRVPNPLQLIQTIGYVPRYIDYKTSYDEINGAFRKQTDGLNDWVAPLTNKYFELYLEALRNDGLNVSDSLTYQFFKVHPNVLDPIFDRNADSSVSSDQLWVNAAFDIKAVRNLDRNGLPY